MPYVEVRHEYSVNGEECFNLYQYYNPNIIPGAVLGIDIAEYWRDNVLPSINAIQMSYVTNTALTVFVPNLATSYSVEVTGAGDLAGGVTAGLPADIALVIKRVVDQSQENDPPGDPYFGVRPVRSGRIFLSGLPKVAIDGTGFVPTALPVGAFNAMESAMTSNALAGGQFWQPVVVGKPLPAVGGKPARAEYLVAPILDIVARRFTSLATRDD